MKSGPESTGVQRAPEKDDFVSRKLIRPSMSESIVPVAGADRPLRQQKPSRMGSDRRPVAVVEQLPLGLAVVEDLEEDHPPELRDALGVAVDPGVLAHDVLDRLDRGPYRHGAPLLLDYEAVS